MNTISTISTLYTALSTFVRKHDLVQELYVNNDNNNIEDNAQYPIIIFNDVNTSIGKGATEYTITISCFDDYVINNDLSQSEINMNQITAKANTELICKDLYTFFYDRSNFNGGYFLNRTSTFNLTPLNTSTKDNVKGYELTITLKHMNNGNYNTTPLKP